MSDTVFIYALNCPITGRTRYVGKAQNPKKRYAAHVRECYRETNHRAHWLRSLRAAGQKPILEIIDEVPTEVWPQWEIAWISFYQEQGFNLVNGNAGGVGAGHGNQIWLGKVHSVETRLKIGKAHRGKTVSAESRAKISAANKGNNYCEGRKLSLETRERISKALTGKILSPEHRAKIGVGLLGKKRGTYRKRGLA